jgi:porin
MHALLLAMVLAAEPAVVDQVVPVDQPAGTEGEVKADPDEPKPDWNHGFHLTGEWGGARTWLEEHGITFDILYAAEIFADAAHDVAGNNSAFTGHLDLAVTIDTGDLGLWPGGSLYFVGQTNHGNGINELVGSTSEVSNIEFAPYVQLGEFFYEQDLFNEAISIRLGKQDANREFGTPRFGGNFINNNFGLIPSTPFPSYPTNGLGAALIVKPVEWLSLKGMLMEGKPQVGSFGFDTAFVPDAGHFLIFGAAAKHTFGPNERNTGTSSAGFFRQQGPLPELADVPEPRTFDSNYGFFLQHDERIFLHPENKDDPRCFTLIARFGWSQPDRTAMPMFVGASLAYHGIGSREDDTIGIGFGYFTVAKNLNGTPGPPGAEFFIEAFYKWRLTHFISLQPDIQYYRTPGGDGKDALLVGMRLKLKG